MFRIEAGGYSAPFRVLDPRDPPSDRVPYPRPGGTSPGLENRLTTMPPWSLGRKIRLTLPKPPAFSRSCSRASISRGRSVERRRSARDVAHSRERKPMDRAGVGSAVHSAIVFRPLPAYDRRALVGSRRRGGPVAVPLGELHPRKSHANRYGGQ